MLIFLLCFVAHGLDLVWQNKHQLFETDWLKELLDELRINSFYDNGTFQTMTNNTVIILDKSVKDPKRSGYFKKLKDLHFKFGVIQLGDEKYKYPVDYYNDTQFVFRNYWHYKFESNPKVTIFPLGYRFGFWGDHESHKQISRCFERRYVWSFSGCSHHGRKRKMMLNHMKNITKYQVIEARSFGEGLSAIDYRNLLLDSIFVPCPAGGNIESFRVWEALECGCIPIVENFPINYYKLFLGNHPLLTVDSWEQAVDKIKGLLTDPERLEALQIKCQTWWQVYKSKIKTQFVSIIKNSLLV